MAIKSQGRHVRANGIRVHYIELAGAGPPLILLPGITSPAITWQFVGERLAAFSHVFILDNRGRGLSSGGPELGYALEDYAADAAAFVECLDLRDPVILGHSMGARIGFKMAASHPNTVGRLIAADPPVSGPGRRPYPIPLQWYLDGLDAAKRGEKQESNSPLLQNWTEDQIALRDEWLPTCDRKAIEETHRNFHDEDIHALLPLVGCPTLLLYAENGNTVRDEDADEITRKVPDCRAVKIPDVGHMIPWDDLGSFVDETRRFVVS